MICGPAETAVSTRHDNKLRRNDDDDELGRASSANNAANAANACANDWLGTSATTTSYSASTSAAHANAKHFRMGHATAQYHDYEGLVDEDRYLIGCKEKRP